MEGRMSRQFSALMCLLVIIGSVDGAASFGRYFRMVFMDNFVDCPVYRPVDVYVCSKNDNGRVVSVNVSIPYLNHQNCPPNSFRNVAPGACERFKLCEEIRHTYLDGSVANKVVDIIANGEVSVQGFNVEKFSADSYAVLPENMWGKIHFVMSYTLQSIQTQFAIITRQTTKIRLVIPDRTGETITIDYRGLRYTNGESVTFALDPRQSFLAQSAGDLTGVMIQSDRPIGVFTGNVRSYNDYTKASRDHLIEQVPPAVTWGREFIYVPTPRRNPGDTVKILAAPKVAGVPDAQISFLTMSGGAGNIDVNVGDDPYIYNGTEITHIKSTRPILVAVFVASQEGKDVAVSDPADPSMYFLPGTNQYDSEYYLPHFLDAEDENYQKVYVMVAVPEDSISSFIIDNRDLGPNPQLLLLKPSSNNALPYKAGAIEVGAFTAHRIFHRNSERMMVIGYGASDRESFASTLGYRFDEKGCPKDNMLVADQVDNDCDGLIDEEICGNGLDDDEDRLLDEDCGSDLLSTGTGDATGTDFAVVFMTNLVRDTNVEIDQIELYISALEDETFIGITAPAYTGPRGPNVTNYSASPDAVLQVQLSSLMRITTNDDDIGQSKITNKVIHVKSNKNIVCYGINKKQYSTDGFMALPMAVIGRNYFAFCNFPINTNDDRCQFAAAAVADNTLIYIELADGISIEPLNGRSYTGPVTFSVPLRAYQVVEIQSINDLTGTRVYTDNGKPHFAFFSGNIRTRIPVDAVSRDHLVEQIPPAETWGTKFSVLPTPREVDLGDVFKVVAREPSTQVTYRYYQPDNTEAVSNFVLSSSGSHQDIDLGYASIMSIEADKPVLVVQISKSATNKDTDPTAIVVISEDRWSNNYRFVTPLSGQRDANGNQKTFNNYVMLAISRSYRADLEYIEPGGTIIPIGKNQRWLVVPGTNNEALLYEVPKILGQSAITHPNADATWMALIFGRADRETYGNAIGLKVKEKIGCRQTSMRPADGVDNDCDGRIDEEVHNGVDDDNDMRIDEDLALAPTRYEFVFAFQENFVEFPRNYALEIYVGHSDTDSKVYCRMQTPIANAPPGQYDVTALVHDPMSDVLKDRIQFAVSAALRTMGTSKAKSGITITCNAMVTVMGINKETFSTDAFIVFEKSALGTEYYTVSFSPATVQTQFAVVAASEGETSVTMRLKSPVLWNAISSTSIIIELLQYEVFQAQSEGDLTGSFIRATKPVAVFSGNIRSKVVLSASRDHLVSQLPPIAKYGQTFVLVPTPFRTVGDVFRVVAGEESTSLRYTLPGRGRRSSFLEAPGDYLQLDLKRNESIVLTTTSNKKVMVMQILKSQDRPFSPEVADPCFLLVPDVSRHVSSISLVTPLYTKGFYRNGKFFLNLLTVILPNGAGNGIRVNGEFVNRSPRVTVRDTRTVGNAYEAVDLKLNDEGLYTYTITHDNVKFSGYLVGIADRESYCVPIGPAFT